MHNALKHDLLLPHALSEPQVLRTGAELVYATLRDAIITGRLAPGARLTEAILVEQFRLSSTPIREALQKLVHHGLGVRHTAKGISVRKLTPRDIADIYELRLLLEPDALRQSVPYLRDEQLVSILDKLRQAGGALESRSYLLLSELNEVFHTAILDGSPNALLLKWIGDLSDQRRLIAVTEWTKYDRAARELDEHFAIYDRIAARDARAAAAILARHIRASSELLLEQLQQKASPSEWGQS